MTQLAFASNSSRSRANQHVGPRPEHEEHGHDPLVGQLTNKFLAGNGNLSPAVLVGLHRQLGSPSAVRATVEAHKNGQPLPTPASLTSRFAAHRSLGAPHTAHETNAEAHPAHSTARELEHAAHAAHLAAETAHLLRPMKLVPGIGAVAAAVGAGLSGYSATMESEAATLPGKVTTGLVAGGAAAVIGELPPIAAVDFITGGALQARADRVANRIGHTADSATFAIDDLSTQLVNAVYPPLRE